MIYGYARVSTLEQSLDLQLRALAPADKIFSDRASGDAEGRPGLNLMMAALSAGDTVMVWRLDRLSRDLRHVLTLLADLEARTVSIVSVMETIDTRTAAGKLSVQVFGALAEFERAQMRERVQAGLEAARARGVVGGRPAALTLDQAVVVRDLAGERSTRELAALFRVSRQTISQAINKRRPYQEREK